MANATYLCLILPPLASGCQGLVSVLCHRLQHAYSDGQQNPPTRPPQALSDSMNQLTKASRTPHEQLGQGSGPTTMHAFPGPTWAVNGCSCLTTAGNKQWTTVPYHGAPPSTTRALTEELLMLNSYTVMHSQPSVGDASPYWGAVATRQRATSV